MEEGIGSIPHPSSRQTLPRHWVAFSLGNLPLCRILIHSSETVLLNKAKGYVIVRTLRHNVANTRAHLSLAQVPLPIPWRYHYEP